MSDFDKERVFKLKMGLILVGNVDALKSVLNDIIEDDNHVDVLFARLTAAERVVMVEKDNINKSDKIGGE